MPLSEEHGRLRAAHPGVRDEQTASVLGALSPTARRILKAAFRVLERDGYEGLSLRRIAAEAGETRSLIAYHFENKAGPRHDPRRLALARRRRRARAGGREPRRRRPRPPARPHRAAPAPRAAVGALPHVLRPAAAHPPGRRGALAPDADLPLVPAHRRAVPRARRERQRPIRSPWRRCCSPIGEGIAVQTLLSGEETGIEPRFALLERRVAALPRSRAARRRARPGGCRRRADRRGGRERADPRAGGPDRGARARGRPRAGRRAGAAQRRGPAVAHGGGPRQGLGRADLVGLLPLRRQARPDRGGRRGKRLPLRARALQGVAAVRRAWARARGRGRRDGQDLRAAGVDADVLRRAADGAARRRAARAGGRLRRAPTRASSAAFSRAAGPLPARRVRSRR